MKPRQYPAQTGSYAVRVKSEQSYDSWRNFQTARLQISVGQEYHEGEKMIATLQWLKPRFNSVQVCVNDSLQRFSIMFEKGLNSEDALKMSEESGRAWSDRYKEAIQEHGDVEIVHWSDWLNRANYSAVRQKMASLYLDNDEFKNLIVNNIREIWSRRKGKDPKVYCDERFHEFFDLSKEYMLEEISVFSLMFEDKRAIDIYPGTAIFAATVLQGRTIPNAPTGLGKGHFCRIDFSKKNQPANSNTHNLLQGRLTP